MWEGLAFQISQAFLIRLPFIDGPQDAHVTGLLDHAEGFDCVALLLATGVYLLVLWLGGAVERSLGAILPTRGNMGPTFVRSAASRTAKSSAMRAGRSSGCAHARFNTALRRCIYLWVCDGDIPKRCPCTSWMGFCCTYVRITRICRPSWARDTCHTYGSGGSGEAAQPW
jgi:hypothetical protein